MHHVAISWQKPGQATSDDTEIFFFVGGKYLTYPVTVQNAEDLPETHLVESLKR